MNNCSLRYTKEFISPEFYNFNIHGFHNDIWALGLTLFTLFEFTKIPNSEYFCLSSETPKLDFTIKTPIKYQILIEKCIEYDYQERISIEELVDILKK